MVLKSITQMSFFIFSLSLSLSFSGDPKVWFCYLTLAPSDFPQDIQACLTLRTNDDDAAHTSLPALTHCWWTGASVPLLHLCF